MTEYDNLRLRLARLQASHAVLVSALAWFGAHEGASKSAKRWLERADEAALRVKLTDLVKVVLA